jgi:segregation and condensation protein A
MATTAGLEIQTQLDAKSIDLESLVSEVTWKEVLIDLVRNEKLDPWNIDIVEIVDKYIQTIKGMKILDLKVPANLILAAAILLRLKSEMLSFDEEEISQEGETVAERPSVIVDSLSFRLRVPPKRRITLPELITALEEAMRLKEMREARSNPAPVSIPIKINTIDIEAEIENVYKQVKSKVDGSRMTTFSMLSKNYNPEDALLGLFVPLLFLAHKRRIMLIQERFFEEIIVALN